MPIHKLLLRRAFALLCCSGALVACYVETGPREECRNTYRRRAEVETCVTRCGEETCRTRCREQERWSREHRCWVE